MLKTPHVRWWDNWGLFLDAVLVKILRFRRIGSSSWFKQKEIYESSLWTLWGNQWSFFRCYTAAAGASAQPRGRCTAAVLHHTVPTMQELDSVVSAKAVPKKSPPLCACTWRTHTHSVSLTRGARLLPVASYGSHPLCKFCTNICLTKPDPHLAPVARESRKYSYLSRLCGQRELLKVIHVGVEWAICAVTTDLTPPGMLWICDPQIVFQGTLKFGPPT